MRCAACQTTPCQVIDSKLTQNAAWLFSEEVEQTLTSGEWCLLFEHLVAQISDPEIPADMATKSETVQSLDNEALRSAPIRPLQETEKYWIWAYCPTSFSPAGESAKVGKWLVFVPIAQVDAAWFKIKEAVE